MIAEMGMTPSTACGPDLLWRIAGWAVGLPVRSRIYRTLFLAPRLRSRRGGEALMAVAKDGRVLLGNAEASALYGYPKGVLETLNTRDLRAPETVGLVAGQMSTASAGRVVFETMHRRKDGSDFPVEITSQAVWHGAEYVLISQIRDLTADTCQHATAHLAREIDCRILHGEPVEDILKFVCERVSAIFDCTLVWVSVKQPDGSEQVLAEGGPAAGGHDAAASHRLSLPLKIHNEVLGALNLCAHHRYRLGEAATRGLSGLADQVAISLISARQREQLRLQPAALEAAANAICVTDSDGRITWVNSAWTRLTGMSHAETLGQKPEIMAYDRATGLSWDQMCAQALAGQKWSGRAFGRRRGGDAFVVEQSITAVRGDAGRVAHLIGVLQDVTEHTQHEEDLHYQAMRDPETGVPTVRWLREHLGLATSRATVQRPGTVLLISLDHFSRVVDTLGRTGANAMLSTLACILRQSLRPEDFLARCGDGQFCIVLEGISVPEAQAVAELLRGKVAAYRQMVDGEWVWITASAGVAPFDGSQTTGAVMTAADSALRLAKESGQNQTAGWDSCARAQNELSAEWRWVERLREALKENRLQVVLTPIIRFDTDGPGFHEVLLRMVDRSGKAVPAELFLPAAEEFCLMAELDRWVIGKAVNLARERRLLVRVSGQSLESAALLDDVDVLLKTNSGSCGNLTFAIAEAAVAGGSGKVREWIARLTERGCRVALDDFGVGLTSFSFLHSLSVEMVRLGSFWADKLGTDVGTRTLLATITTLAHSLGASVIAPAVRDEEEAARWRSVGTDYGQGTWWRQAAGQPAHWRD